MPVSPEEFFMYLTIALIVLIPVSARLYRRVTMKRTTEMLRRQFDRAEAPERKPE
jgi:hypothetical protein